MGEVAGAHYGEALFPGRAGKRRNRHLLARGPGVAAVDVEIRKIDLFQPFAGKLVHGAYFNRLFACARAV